MQVLQRFQAVFVEFYVLYKLPDEKLSKLTGLSHLH